MTPQEFIAKWKPANLTERGAAQEHFLDLCELLGQPKPAAADPEGAWYAFERGVHKTGGGQGWADVCEQLLSEFPGAVITAQNSFAAKRLSIEDFRKYAQERLRQGTLEPWSWKTMDELNSGVDLLIADNRRAELRSGPKKDLAIPLT